MSTLTWGTGSRQTAKSRPIQWPAQFPPKCVSGQLWLGPHVLSEAIGIHTLSAVKPLDMPSNVTRVSENAGMKVIFPGIVFSAHRLLPKYATPFMQINNW